MKLPKNFPKISNKDENFFEERAQVLRAISDPNCLKILDLLFRENGPCVSDITKKLDISISAVSHQLNKLKSLNIIDTKREGQTICCSFSDSKNANLARMVLEKM